jgi:hypothetical protein
MKSPIKRLLATLVVLLFALSGYWLYVEIKIDKCLDAGGAWNPDKRACEH